VNAVDVVKPSVLKEVLRRHGFSFKKQLGQNFLIDERVLTRIVDAAELGPDDGVFEIGPGAGVLTRWLAERAKRVVAVEKDAALRPVLAETLAGCENVVLRFADALQLDLAPLWTEFSGCRRVVMAANLPYYVTTPLLFHVLESRVPLDTMVLMVQREVADRLTASPGGKDYGALTVAVQYHTTVERVCVVHPGAFLPPPNVDSTVVRLRRRRRPAVDVLDEAAFFRIVRAAFSVRRKTLLNALSSGLGMDKDQCRMWLEASGIDPNRRGETLNLHEFAALANTMGARDL
jgi:16S rRNA (adenine1518-N6/adenine1519-N6)-dimethyltransferase